MTVCQYFLFLFNGITLKNRNTKKLGKVEKVFFSKDQKQVRSLAFLVRNICRIYKVFFLVYQKLITDIDYCIVIFQRRGKQPRSLGSPFNSMSS